MAYSSSLMKLLLLLCLFPFTLSAQQLDSCGLHNNPTLNQHEAAYFNVRFQKTREAFDFTGKRLIFITGDSGSVLGSKREYFNYVKQWQAEHGRNDIGGSRLTPLTEAQRMQSGGYDAIVTYWSKFQPSAARVIKRVSRKAGKNKYPLPG